MAIFTRKKALSFLCQAIGNPRAEFRSDQYEAVDKIVNDHAKLLVVQATGWGKSLVYFLGTKFMRLDGAGPTLLISPLLALMRNQILMAERIGIKAATINSNNPDEWESVNFEPEFSGEHADSCC
jgi:ATP-dependent DNA helicase RecQ